MALNAFQQWPAESWPSEARGFIEARHRPNEQTRELLGEYYAASPPIDDSCSIHVIPERTRRSAISAGYSPLMAWDASAHSSTCPRGKRFRARAAARAASSITLRPAISANTGQSSDRNWSSVNDFGIAFRMT